MVEPLRVQISKSNKSFNIHFLKVNSNGNLLTNKKLLDTYVENGGELFISIKSYERSKLKDQCSKEFIKKKLAKRVYNTKSIDFPMEALEILDNIYFT